MNTYKVTATVELEISNEIGREYTRKWPCSATITASDEGAALAIAKPLLVEEAEEQLCGVHTDIIDCELLNLTIEEITTHAVMLALPREVAPLLPGFESAF